MYVVPLKSALVEATKSTFGSSYPNPDFRNTYCSIEYPAAPQNYPGIWINYEDTGPLERAGIAHVETITDSEGLHEVTRWRYEGSVSFTIGALSSLERDRLYDEMVRVLAFNGVDPTSTSFKGLVESNDFIVINLNYDTLNPSGDAANPGTPWGTSEIIYERTISTEVIGEFVSDPTTNLLLPLSAVLAEGFIQGTPIPNFPDVPDNGDGRAFSPNVW